MRAPTCLSGGHSTATNIQVVHTLLMGVQSTFDIEPEEPRRRLRGLHGSFSYKNHPNWPSSKNIRVILLYASSTRTDFSIL